jgi:hypothetical protein
MPIAFAASAGRYKYFPEGGLTSPKDGSSYHISTSEFLTKIGKY